MCVIHQNELLIITDALLKDLLSEVWFLTLHGVTEHIESCVGTLNLIVLDWWHIIEYLVNPATILRHLLSPTQSPPPLFQMVVKTFMDMDQDSEEEKELYLNLALHLASDFFLKHPDKDVRLLVACCLADIFRIYAPEAPYTSPDKLKVMWWRFCSDAWNEILQNYITPLHQSCSLF